MPPKTIKKTPTLTPPLNNIPSISPSPPQRDYIQKDLHGAHQELLDVEEYGDTMRRKNDSTLRIMLHNINRLPLSGNTSKSHKLISTIAYKQIDIALLTEIGLFWKAVDNKEQWYE